ncbi:MAG: hypothetical protein Q9216_001504 [Gyalolechia sp. 2 TL-2023]
MLLCHIRQRKSFGGSGEMNGGRGRHSLLFALGVVPSIVGGVAVGALLGWTNTSRSEVSSYMLGLRISTYLFVSFILWGVSVVTQILFFACLAWASHPVPKLIQEPSISTRDERQEMMEPSRPTTSTTVQSNPFQGEPSNSNSPSAIPSEAASLRSSLSIKTRPTAAKGKFLNRQHTFQSRSSFDNPVTKTRSSQDEAFDSWDTSAVGSHIRETVLQSSPVVKPSALEPIPGSRSPSPAKALEGPFFQHGPNESPPPSPLPQPTISRPMSRARSASSEDHIHPLFRTCTYPEKDEVRQLAIESQSFDPLGEFQRLHGFENAYLAKVPDVIEWRDATSIPSAGASTINAGTVPFRGLDDFTAVANVAGQPGDGDFSSDASHYFNTVDKVSDTKI